MPFLRYKKSRYTKYTGSADMQVNGINCRELCKSCGYAYGHHSGLSCDNAYKWANHQPEFINESLNINIKIL